MSTENQTIKKARNLNFGPTALNILFDGTLDPINPYDYFGTEIRRSWAYAYFARLLKHDLIEECEAPAGRRGTWYRTVN